MTASETTEMDVSGAVPKGNRRPDIQGLRAIAVLAVIAFHAGLPVPGGFVGVDIFFVISGYVITGMLQRQWASSGRIRFRAFYWRRFKRLTPALGLMVAVTVVLSLLLQSPLGAQQTTAFTALGAMALVANIVITATTGNYFDAPAGTNPLLHTWSLSVEEQFYLIFPLILVVSWLLARRFRLRSATSLAILLVAAISFAAACVGTYVGVGPRTDWLIGFYGPLSRAWEFAIGSLLVIIPAATRGRHPRVAATLSVVGLIFVAMSLWLINENTPFPGLWTLLPVAGTALLLVAGAANANLVSRSLSNRSMVWLGDRSYALYLWHWPLIVFALVIWPFTPFVSLAAALVSFAPAILSFRFVEDPLRRWVPPSKRRGAGLVAIVVGVPVALALGLLLLATAVLGPAFQDETRGGGNRGTITQDAFSAYFNRYSEPCPGDVRPPVPTSPAGTPLCNQSKAGLPADVVIIGDSHAAQLFPGLAESLPDRNVAFLDSLGAPDLREGQDAGQWIRDYFSHVSPGATVILAPAWFVRHVSPDQLQPTIEFITKTGANVVLLGDVPDFPFDAAACKYPRSVILTPLCSRNTADYRDLRAADSAELRELADQLPATTFVDGAAPFCGTEECQMAIDGQMQYRDRNHLGEAGSRRLAESLVSSVPGLATGGTIKDQETETGG